MCEEDFPEEPDVREHMARLLSRDAPAVADVEWGRFSHAYGPAGDVPDLLDGLRGHDPEQALSLTAR